MINNKLEFDVDVLVIGGGPVGATLSMDLAMRGAKVMVVERRADGDILSARCNAISARSMEVFRRFGVADQVRASGLPDAYPNDVVYSTSLNGYELGRIPLASRLGRYTDMESADAGWPTPEPVHRSCQMYFERLLLRHAAKAHKVQVLYKTNYLDYTEDAQGVSANLIDIATNKAFTVRARYFVGADGGRSVVRRQIGANFTGDAAILRNRSYLIRAPWMLDHLKHKPAWMYWFMGPGPVGGMLAIDGADLWLMHVLVPYGVKDFEDFDAHSAIRGMLELSEDQSYEVVQHTDWTTRRLVADQFRCGRVFLCGDAAHIWIPWGGYGMNAGIADAVNLGMHLGAVLQGWGGQHLLDCYNAERRPITEQVSRFAMDNALEYVADALHKVAPPQLGAASLEGENMRRAFGERLLKVNEQQFAAKGLNFGYFYDSSPAIIYDDEPAPAYSMDSYQPSTVPGCRMPHFWLSPDVSVYDRLSLGFTLLRFDPETKVKPLQEAAVQRNVPLELLDATNPDPALFTNKLLLVRSDQQIVWRGDTLPADSLALIDVVRGARLHLVQARAAAA